MHWLDGADRRHAGGGANDPDDAAYLAGGSERPRAFTATAWAARAVRC
jgi:hypothetical protein